MQVQVRKIGILLFVICLGNICFGQTLIINEFMSSNVSTIHDFEGEASDWIEIYNNQNTAVNLEGYSLTDNPDNPQKWVFPDVDIAANGYLFIWASGKDLVALNGENHTNFKISSDGESLQLYSPTGQLLDESPSVELDPDVSYGRIPSDLVNWYYFLEPTPKVANLTTPNLEQVESPILSNTSGFYTTEVTVELTPEHPSDVIRYTLDGSAPTTSSSTYTAPITINETKVLRIKGFRANAIPSKIFTHSYLFEDDLNLPVVSLATDHSNFYGATGIYQNYDSGEERPIHLEYFEKNQSFGFKINMGVKTHGADDSPQKSLRLYARSEYGKKEIDYPIFDDLDITKFKRLILRNGANDGTQKNRIHIKDGFVHELYKSQNSEYSISAYQPVHVFLNGNYFGIYNLRERQDEYYIKSHFGYKKDEIDFLEYDYAEPGAKKTVCGNWDDWNALKAFLLNQDISTEANYQVIEDWIDVENFIDYQIFEIFIGNADWLNNNMKFWRPKAAGGKWKWVLWDTEYALGTQINYPVGQPDFDFVHFAMTHGGWGSGDHTWMLRNLMDNEAFKEQFIQRFSDLLNTTFLADYLLDQLDEKANQILPDIAKQFSKWGGSMSSWNAHYAHTKYFIENRPPYNRTHLANKFNLNQDMSSIELNVSDVVAGNIQINSIFIDENTLGWQDQPYPWQGFYFKDYDVQVTAIPKNGFTFSHWEGDNTSSDPILNITLTDNVNLTAVFESDMTGSIPSFPLVINEVMTSNNTTYPDEFGEYEDWIEIYNTGNEAINLGGLYFTDDISEPTKWKIPVNDPNSTIIETNGFLTFFADKDIGQGPLHIDFKLSQAGETVALFYQHSDNSIHLIDQVTVPSLEENTSWGRLPNGGPDWITFAVSTPNSFNIIDTTPIPDFSLVINEVMTSNSNIYSDEFGEYEDWIEIYNTGNEAIDLGGLYFTDDLNEPTKWQIPVNASNSTTIETNEFLTFFADKDAGQGVLHLDFKLSQAGETVALFYRHSDNSIHLIDQVTVPSLEENTSYGRLPNGGPDWIIFEISTPNFSNEIIDSVENEISEEDFLVFPNPTEDILYIKVLGNVDEELNLQIIDILGREILQKTIKTNDLNTFNFKTQPLASGTYFIKINHQGNSSNWVKKIIFLE